MSARERVLARLREARRTAGGPEDEAGRAEVARRTAARRPYGPVPELGERSRIERFAEKAAGVQCTVESVASLSALPGAVAEALRDRNLPASVRMGGDPRFADLDWRGLEVSVGAARLDEPVALSRAVAGVAETGSLAFLSGPENPVTLTFAGDHHLVALFERDVVGNFEEVWARIREAELDPRTVNFVTGPSRSADIEQRLNLGAHGPVSVHVFLIGEDA